MEIIGGLILIVFACYAIGFLVRQIFIGVTWLCVHVVPWVMVFLAPGVVLFWYLRTERVQLTLKSTLAVFLGCGLAAWLGTFLLVSGSSLPSQLALPIAAGFFFTSAFVLLSTWAQCRRLAAWLRLERVERRLEAAAREQTRWEEAARGHRSRARVLQDRFQDLLADHARASEEIATMCSAEPRTLGLLTAQVSEAARDMSPEEIATALAAVAETNECLGSRLRALVLRRELAGRQPGAPTEQIAACLAAAEEAERHAAEARAVLDGIRTGAAHHIEFYKGLRSSPVVL